MTFIALDFEAGSDSTRFSHTGSPMSQEGYQDFHMPSSRSNTSPYDISPDRATLRPRDRLRPISLDQASARAASQDDYRASRLLDDMPAEHLSSADPRPRPTFSSLQDRQSSKPRPRGRGQRTDYGSLVGIGAWSSGINSSETRCSRSVGFDDFVFDNAAAKDLPTVDDAAAPDARDDFILFPGEGDPVENYLASTKETSSAPWAPCIPRLRTPDFAPLSIDFQLFPYLESERHKEEKDDEDRINESWYLTGRHRVDSQHQSPP